MNNLNDESRRRLENGKYIRLLDSALPPKSHPNYDLWKDYALSGVDRGKYYLKHIPPSKSVAGADVLDFGCGEGGHSVAFAEAGANVVGIDSDGDRIERARALAEDFGVSVDLRVDASYGESIPEKSFDIIICVDVIEHVDSFKQLAMSNARLLRDDGILLLTVPNRYSMRTFFGGDPHYRIKGISLFGPRLAGLYVTKICKRVGSYEVKRLLGWHEVRRIYRRAGIELSCQPDEGLFARLKARELSSPFKRVIATFLPPTFLLRVENQFMKEFWVFVGRKTQDV